MYEAIIKNQIVDVKILKRRTRLFFFKEVCVAYAENFRDDDGSILYTKDNSVKWIPERDLLTPPTSNLHRGI